MTGAPVAGTFAASASTRALWPISHAVISRDFSRCPAQHRFFRRAHSASRRSRSRSSGSPPHRCRGRPPSRTRSSGARFGRDFLVPKDLAFLNAANLCPMSLPVVEAIEKNMRGYEVNPAPEPRSKLLHAREDARTMLAEALRVTPEEIVLTRNTTEGNNFVSSGLTLGAGDEVIVSTDNHPSNLNAWRQKAKRFGFTVVEVPPPSSSPGRRRLRRALLEGVHAAHESAGDQLREQQLGRHASRRARCASWRASATCFRSSTARRRSACST